MDQEVMLLAEEGQQSTSSISSSRDQMDSICSDPAAKDQMIVGGPGGQSSVSFRLPSDHQTQGGKRTRN